MIRREIGILGGGISAIALASRLGEDVEILEKRDRIGGLCATIVEDGFTFDAAGPHIMFSKNKDVLNLMISVLGDNVHQNRRENRIYYGGKLVKYPFENDLAALPKEDNFDCLYGYIENPRANDPVTSLSDWSYKTFGAGISEKYFIPYNEKIWNYDAKKIGLEFVERIPKPPVADVIKSAIGISTEGYLHQLYYSYPTNGGFEAIVHAFAKEVRGDIRTNVAVTGVEKDGEGWRVETTDGARWYRTLINTIPIHELMKVWKDAPDDARSWLARLRYNSLVNVLIGCNSDPGHNYTALYVPDPQILFHRLSFPKAFGSECVPPGGSSIMAEITTNAGEDGVWEMDDETLTEKVIADIARIGFVDPQSIVYKRVARFLYGYPVYDLEYRKNVTEMRNAVARTGLRLLGRFAQFDYINSDVCVERALKMAEELSPVHHG